VSKDSSVDVAATRPSNWRGHFCAIARDVRDRMIIVCNIIGKFAHVLKSMERRCKFKGRGGVTYFSCWKSLS
jgi:hypothetical protein